jgi:Spy/CpxP family protein refolding chaperone
MSHPPSAISLRVYAFLAVAVLVAAPARAQVSPYAAEPPRAIQALSDQEVGQLLEGAGMGFARAAELNGVPGPRHSLDMAAELHLDDGQRARLEEVFARMNARARELGAAIVARERELDALFASGAAAAADVGARSAEIGRLYGELRAAHLVAHLETAAILNPHQVERYAQLRGYADAAHDGAPADHGAHH